MTMVSEGIKKVGMGIQPPPLGCSEAHWLIGATFHIPPPNWGPRVLVQEAESLNKKR